MFGDTAWIHCGPNYSTQIHADISCASMATFCPKGDVMREVRLQGGFERRGHLEGSGRCSKYDNYSCHPSTVVPWSKILPLDAPQYDQKERLEAPWLPRRICIRATTNHALLSLPLGLWTGGQKKLEDGNTAKPARHFYESVVRLRSIPVCHHLVTHNNVFHKKETLPPPCCALTVFQPRVAAVNLGSISWIFFPVISSWVAKEIGKNPPT